MENIELIRKLVLVEGLSQSEVARRLGHTKRSVSKALKDGQPRQYTLTAPRLAPCGWRAVSNGQTSALPYNRG